MTLQTIDRNGIIFKCSINFKTLEDYATYVFQEHKKAVRLNAVTMINQYKDIIVKLGKAGITEQETK